METIFIIILLLIFLFIACVIASFIRVKIGKWSKSRNSRRRDEEECVPEYIPAQQPIPSMNANEPQPPPYQA
jgi:ABC-type cobalt transport system substrate-binding protein